MFSRRARVILGTLVVVALTLVILSLRGGGGPLGLFRNATGAALGSLQSGASTLVSPVFAAGDWLGALGDQKERIATLESENEQLRQLAERSASDRARADSLDGLLRVAGLGQYRIIPAQVIAVGPAQDFAWTVTIDAGSRDGIEPDMTVINGQGLVGRVVAVNPFTASVALVVDASTSVGARVAGSEEIGILSGTGTQDSLEFQLLDPLADLQPGQALVTFGSKSGRPYAPGIPIGTVATVTGTGGSLTRIATVSPFADVSRLNIVGVVIEPPRTDPRDSVLPKTPDRDGAGTPTAEPTAAPDGEAATPAPELDATPAAG